MRSGPELTVRLHGGKSECESRGPAVWFGDGDRFRGYDPMEASATTASAPTEARARASTSTKDQGVFPTESGIGRAKGSGVRAQLLRLRKVASANHRKRRQPASSQGISRAAELKPPSHAFSGAVPGTHPAACKRPWERPRRGAAKPQSPAPRPNRPPGKKMHASPDRGGREASNEPL